MNGGFYQPSPGDIYRPRRFADADSMGVANLVDPYYANVTSLLHCDGSEGSTTFTDEKGLTWTRLGTAQITETQSKFGGACLASGTIGVFSPVDGGFAFGTGDFSVEFFYRPTSVAGGLIVMDSRPSTASAAGFALYTSGVSLRMYTNGADRIIGPNLAVGNWYLIELARVSGVSRLFVNGVQGGSNYTDANNYTATRFAVGCQQYDNVAPTNAYYDELRFTKGVGRHTAAYTPPTQAFPNA